MTADEFRELALEIPGSVESAHMSHPDFRISGKIFAAVGYPDGEHGMVTLTPEQQRTFLKKTPSVFSASTGAWGKRGSTTVYLRSAKLDLIRTVLDLASKNVIRKAKT
ncbi:MAG: MmcQ/YjbR family DNA-binding protein [Chthoniobacterales bacterium]